MLRSNENTNLKHKSALSISGPIHYVSSQLNYSKDIQNELSICGKLDMVENKSDISKSVIKNQVNLPRQEENSLVINNFDQEVINIDIKVLVTHNLNNTSEKSTHNNKIIKLTKNQAYQIINFSKFSQEVFEELNKARRYPVSYARKLRKLLNDTYKEKQKNGHIEGIIILNGYTINLRDKKSSFEEAIKFLMGQAAYQPFIEKEKMQESANDLLNILILHDGLIESYSKDSFYNSKFLDTKNRIAKYGISIGDCKEIFDYGSLNPEQVVLNLIVCDGNLNKRTREIIFSPKFKFASVCSGLTPSDKVCTVINFCEMFFQKGDIISGLLLKNYNLNLNKFEEICI